MSAKTSGYEHEEAPGSNSPQLSSHDDKKEKTRLETVSSENGAPQYEGEEDRRGSVIVTTAEDLVTQVIGLEDDPSLSPWTFRAMFLGMSELRDHFASERIFTYSLV
jgi:hypothetical protein